MVPITKAIVVFSSVCGNTFLVAQAFTEVLERKGIHCHFRRVEHTDLASLAMEFPVAAEYHEHMLKIPVVKNSDLLDADLVVVGSPTYFGNMSAEMKRFFDSTSVYYREGNLAGKRMMAFSTAGSLEGGAHLCLQTMITFGMHIGMIPVPVPPQICISQKMYAFGLTHYSGDMGDQRPSKKTHQAISSWVDWVLDL